MLSFELVSDKSKLDDLEGEWEELVLRSSGASLYAGFEFVSSAWSSFHSPRDELFVIVARRHGAPVLIAPLRRSIETDFKVPLRVIRFIAEWEGDRPQLLSSQPEEEAWKLLHTFLSQYYKDWDCFELAEQSNASLISQAAFVEKSYHLDLQPDAIGWATALRGTWDDYLKSLSNNRQRNFRRQSQKFEEKVGRPIFDRYGAPEEIVEGLQQFISIERMSWKQGAGIGVSRSKTHEMFWHEFLLKLARKGRAAVHCLRTGDSIKASFITAEFQRRAYALQTAYNPEFGPYSPGMLLLGHVLKQCFGRDLDEFDMLSTLGESPHKSMWGNRKYETTRLKIYRKFGRAFPLLFGRRIKRAGAEWAKALTPARSALVRRYDPLFVLPPRKLGA